MKALSAYGKLRAVGAEGFFIAFGAETMGETQLASSQNACRIHVAVRIFDERERWHISQILGVGARRTHWDIRIVPANEADVIIFNPEDPGANVFLSPQGGLRRPIPVAYGDLPVGNMLHLPKPARSETLITLLDTLRDQISDLEPEPAEGEGGLLSLLPTRDFTAVLKGLDRLRGKAEAGCIGSMARPMFLVDHAKKTAWIPRQLSSDGLVDYCRVLADLEDTDFRKLTPDQFECTLRAGKFFPLSLESFAWTVSFLSTPLRLSSETALGRMLRLKRWPDFPRFDHDYSHVVWAGAMLRKAVALNTLIKWTDGDTDGAVRFYNALLVSGLLLDGTGRQDSNPVEKQKTSGRSGILKMVLRKLGTR